MNTAGDINGDGVSDLVLGYPYAGNGTSYVVFGNRKFTSLFDLASLNGKNGFTVSGIGVSDSLGVSVSTAGDINGDGLSDIILGDPAANSVHGACYVIFGKSQLVWISNQMIITEGQKLILNATNLNVSAFNNSGNILVFMVSNVRGGRFELVSAPTTATNSFTQQQITNHQIRFVSDRTAPVAYNVNATDGQSVLPTIPADVTFINHLPQVVNIPGTKLLTIGQTFDFSLVANDTFIDSDGDPLTYSAKQSDGSVLPSWLDFDNAQPNQLHFNGTAPSDIEGVTVSMFATDPLNASANTSFQIVTVPGSNNNGTTNILAGASLSEIAGGVVGGVLGLAAAIGAGLGFWRYATNKSSRSGEQFADSIRSSLNLESVDNFSSETGRQFVTFVHSLQSALKEAGLNTSTMRALELRQLADDIASAARTKN